MLGTNVGSYRVVRQLGEGGMGRVYLAQHTIIGKHAAIKVLLPQYSAAPEIVNRFFNEARAASLLKHPGVIDIYDFGRLADKSAYIVMEYLEGESLSALITRERHLDAERMADIARQVANALAVAHERGIVHRDLKPDNIFLVEDAETRIGLRAKVLDFGIAKLIDDTSSPGGTRTGAIIGTPTYMSPEQCRGAGHVDHRTDIYALGCVMFEMASGHPPFAGEGPGDVIAAHIFQPPPSLAGVLPAPLAADVARMLAKDPQERFQSMREVAARLGQQTTPARRSEPIPTPTVKLEAQPAVAPAPTARSQPIPIPTHLQPSATVYQATTTLGDASGELGQTRAAARERQGTAIIVAVAGVLLLGGGAVFWATRSNRTTSTSAAPAPPVEPVAPAAQPVAIPQQITVKLTSEPAGAEVFRVSDGVRVGTAPVTMQVPRATGEALFKLRLRGYRDIETSVPLDRDSEKTAVLEKIHAAHKAAARSTTAQQPATTDSSEQKRPTKNGVVDPFAN